MEEKPISIVYSHVVNDRFWAESSNQFGILARFFQHHAHLHIAVFMFLNVYLHIIMKKIIQVGFPVCYIGKIASRFASGLSINTSSP